MKPTVVRRTVVSIPGAVLLSVILASQALAATWSAPMPLTSSGIAFAQGLGTVGSSTALALYIEHTPDMPDVGFSYRLKFRRSTNSGASWDPAVTLAEDGLSADIAARGSAVDIVWDKINSNSRIRYTRSLDGGMTFQPPVALSPKGKSAWNPRVARGPNGVVVVAWENLNTGVLKVRVSTDGGTTFAPEVNLANVAYDMGMDVAVGMGVIYVAYAEDFDELRIKRSTDDGATWSPTAQVTNNMYGVREQFSITAVSNRAYIAYAVETAGGNSDVKYRRSTDKGASWGAEAPLSPVAWNSWEPDIAVQGGVLRAVFTRRGSPIRVYYRQSTDGINWAPSELAASGGYEASVGFATKIIVLYRVGTGDAYVVTGTP